MKTMGLRLFAFLLFASASLASPKDMTYLGEITDNLCAGAGSHTSMMKSMSIKTPKECAIACAKSGGKYVLFNKGAKTIYELDDQVKPAQFAGSQVKVTGTLNKTTKTIHVTEIQPAA